MHIFNNKFLRIVILLIVSISITAAENKLAIKRKAANILKINLANSEEVAELKFKLNVSSDISIEKIHRGTRTIDQQWIIAVYRESSTAICVLILNMERDNLPTGDGSVAEISFSCKDLQKSSRVLLNDVSIANNKSENLKVSVNNLDMFNQAKSKESDNKRNYFLSDNFPNPFNPTTIFDYSLTDNGYVSLKIYNLLGCEIATIVDGLKTGGKHQISWNGSNFASGTYFARIIVTDVNQKVVLNKIQKLLLAK